MINISIKRIWLICLCLASLSLAWCFHVPDEDWLPSRNKVETTQKDDNVEQALNSFMYWVDMVSSQRNAMKNDEVEINENEVLIEESEEITDEKNIDWKETKDIITEE